MTKTKSTKHALIMSVMALFLCFTMLLGTTFAWFTDSVTSANNIIKSGNLDVELEYSTDMVNWTAVDANTNIFDDEALWEPGYTEVVYLRVSNLGSLALKYKLGIEVADETAGKTKDNVEFKLSDYIEYGVAKDITSKYEDRAAALAAITTATKLNTAYSEEFHLAGKTNAATDIDMFALVVYMPESIDNAANHNGTDIPEIKLGLSVLATQDTVENDSFDDQYDKDATYPGEVKTVEELVEAVKAGESVKLVENITVQSGTNLTFEKDATIDLAGNDLVISNGASLETKSGELNIVNNSEEEASIVLNGGGSTIKASGADSVINVDNVDITTGTAATERIQVMNGATFNMYDGKLVSTGKPCVNLEHGTFNMYGGEIVVPSNCSSGAIAIKNVGTTAINLYGGKITVASGKTGIVTYMLDSLYISEDFVFELEDNTAYSLQIISSQAPTITGKLPENVKQ